MPSCPLLEQSLSSTPGDLSLQAPGLPLPHKQKAEKRVEEEGQWACYCLGPGKGEPRKRGVTLAFAVCSAGPK